MIRSVWLVVAVWLIPLTVLADTGPALQAERGLAYARGQGDEAGISSFYAPDAVVRPDYQPAFCGRDVTAYVEAVTAWRTLAGFESHISESFELGHDVLVFGTFTATGVTSDGAPFTEVGRFARLWAPGPDGRPRILTEVIGHPVHQQRPDIHYAPMPPLTCALPGSDVAVQARLDGMAAVMARAVKDKDGPTQIAFYADDAVLMPFEQPDVVGLAVIGPYLQAYVDNGRGAIFDSVRVWNDGFVDYGDYIVEATCFEVKWRAGNDGGIVSGGGLRLWRRTADGELRLLRQIATHDYRR